MDKETYDKLVKNFFENNKKNEGKMTSTLIRRIQNKNNSHDVFLNAKMNGKLIYTPMAKSKLVAMKYNKISL